jgi:long-chain acyl-CoA synthetase
VLAAGDVAIPINPAAPVPEIVRQLTAVEPALVLADTSSSVADAARSLGVEIRPLSSNALPSTPERIECVDRADDDLAVLLFTAGTAGAPKAAMLTHGNLVANIRQVLDHPGLSMHASDVGYALLPFFHVYGLNVSLGVALAAGASVIVRRDFRPADALAAIREERVSVVSGVPTMWAAWLALDAEAAPPGSFASVRLAVSGAAALPREVAEGVLDRFGLVVHEGYGLTEASPIVTTSAVVDAPRFGTIGPPLPGIEVRLVDVDGADALQGDPGEIWVRGPNVFAGYWRDAGATAPVLTSEGWLRTGDVAIADEAGFLSLVDRTKDLIIVSGFNVYPAEVEDVVREHPDVEEVAVIGRPSPRTGEAVAAFVVPRAGARLAVADLDAWCGARLARYKVPVSIEVVDALPRTPVGKVLRRELRAPDATTKPA